MENKNKPAHPTKDLIDNSGEFDIIIESNGLTKLEYFSGLFLQAIISTTNPNQITWEEGYESRAKKAVDYAKALLSTLDKEKDN